MGLKIQYLIILFILFAILAFNNKKIKYIYNTNLGRIFLICVVIFFTMNNLALGVLSVFLIIACLNNNNIFEGMNTTDSLTSDSNSNALTNTLTSDSNSNALTNTLTIDSDGIDKNDIENAIRAKNSKSIPVTKSSSEEVSAHNPRILKNEALLNEDPYASPMLNGNVLV
jgi:hypothetical protein